MITEKIKALENFKSDIFEYIRLEVIENEAYIADMNAQIQLYEMGVDANNRPLTPEYSALTVSIKQAKNQPTSRVTLHDTGDFHASFYVYAMNDKFYIDARDPITEDLVAKYGESIFGLIAEHVSELAQEYIKPALLTKLKAVV